MSQARYPTLHARIVANSVQHPDHVQGCWCWTGATRGMRGARPSMSMRRPGKRHPVPADPLRLLLECGPTDEASHLCEDAHLLGIDNYLCVNPDHAVAESKRANLMRRDGLHVALPVRAECDPDADIDWPPVGVVATVCPF